MGGFKSIQSCVSTPMIIEEEDQTRTVRPACGQESTKEIEKRTMFDREDVTDSTSTERPVCGSESTKRCVLTPTHIEEDQPRTVRPVVVEELDIDFRVPGLSHASCERSRTFPSSRARQKVRKSSSSRSTSSRLAAE